MTFTFKITEEDFLNFQLYTISKSAGVKRKMKRGRIFVTIAAILLAFNMYVSESSMGALVMIAIAVTSYLFYPNYHRWRTKRHYVKYIKKNYVDHFGKEETLVILKNGIFSKNIAGEGEVKSSELEKLVETEQYFFLKMKSGSSIILPKLEIKETQSLVNGIKKLGVSFYQDIH